MEVGRQRKVVGGEIRRPNGVYSLSKTATSRRGTDATVMHSSNGGVSEEAAHSSASEQMASISVVGGARRATR